MLQINSSNAKGAHIPSYGSRAFFSKRKNSRTCVSTCQDVMRAATPIYGRASAIRTVPPLSARVETRMHVNEHDNVIDMTNNDDDGCSSDDSQRTMAYPDPTRPLTNTDIPTAKTVQPARNGDHYDRFAIPCFSGSNVVKEDIPQSLVQAYLQVRRAQARDGVTGVEPGMCTNNKCTYCKGGLLRQYYSLLERLVQIDTELNRNP